MNKLHEVADWIKKHKIVIWSLIVFIISLCVRFYNIEERMWWNEDTGRDILVGYHMAHYHEIPQLGPPASYLATYSYSPPYYYYLIGLVASFVSDAASICKVFIFLESFLPVFIFFIGLFVGNFTGAVFASLFVAISSYMVYVSNLWSPYVALPLFYFGLVVSFVGKKRGFIFRILGQAILFFSATIHYSFFIPSVVMLFWNTSQEKDNGRKIVFFGAQMVYLILLISPLFINLGSRVFDAFDPRHILDFHQPVSIFIGTLKNIYSDLFQNNSVYELLSAGTCLLLIVFSFKNILSFLKANWWIWCIIFGMPFVGSVFIQHPYIYVYTALVPTILLLVACSSIRTEELTWQNIVRGLLLLCFAFCLSNNFSESFTNRWGYYQQNEKLTDHIIADAKSRGLENKFRLFVSYPNSADFYWSSPNFWYFIETKYHHKIVHVVNYGINLELLNSLGGDTYLVCRGGSDTIIVCKRNFQSSFPEYTREVIVELTPQYAIFLYVGKSLPSG